MSDLKPRIIRIQKALKVDADGIIGPATLTAAEKALGLEMIKPATKANPVPKPIKGALHSMTPSVKGVNLIIGWEVGSESYYNKRLAKPSWPGGASGVTIGIGYDVGMNTATQVEKDWAGRIPDAYVQDLKGVAGISGVSARDAAKRLANAGIVIPWDAAKAVYSENTLARYAATTLRAYPGVDKLPHDAQAAMLSLVFNRGSSKTGSSRREMKDLGPAVAAGDLNKMAELFRSMKRLWVGKGLDGLLRRRDEEADLILKSKHKYGPNDFIVV